MPCREHLLKRSLVVALGVMAVIGCPRPAVNVGKVLEDLTADRLEPFGSTEEFKAYVHRIREARGDGSGFGVLFGCAATRASQAPSPSVTNNQEQGVDEGDIVKAAGDYLLILRRGRLFSVSLGDSEGAAKPVDQIDAHAPGFTGGSWYDEMLVQENRIVVVGFSYQVGATEVGLFRLDPRGGLHHEATHFVRSNDYYSSRNYASRLVDGQLILYMPYYLFSDGVSLPSKRSWLHDNRTTRWEPIVREAEMYRPVQPTLTPTLHTIVSCDLTHPGFDCSSRAFIGPYSRSFYVSPRAVYVWVSPGYEEWSEGNPRASRSERDAFVYRMPLDSGPVRAMRARGTPVDQFSFREDEAGNLDVVVTGHGMGDGMWGPELARGSLALLRAPKDAFSSSPRPVDGDRYTTLPSPQSGSIQNRFVGEYLLWGAGGGWGSPRDGERRVFVTQANAPFAVREVPLHHAVDRIEALGGDAAVVGTDGANLHLSAVRLGRDPEVRAEHIVPDAGQGETRSHGFFFQPEVRGGGVLGLPVRHDGAAWRQLLYGSAEVLFLRVKPSLSIAPMGSLAASETRVDDRCEVSCADWYGNARPIFYRGRVFALLGYELVEGHLGPTAIKEEKRVQFLMPPNAYARAF